MSDFDNLKPGDIVVVFRDNGWHEDQILFRAVERTTSTLVIVDGKRFRKGDGYGPPNGTGGWSRRERIEYPITEKHQEQRRAYLTRLNAEKLSRVNWSKQPAEVIEAVAKLVLQDKKAGEG